MKGKTESNSKNKKETIDGAYTTLSSIIGFDHIDLLQLISPRKVGINCINDMVSNIHKLYGDPELRQMFSLRSIAYISKLYEGVMKNKKIGKKKQDPSHFYFSTVLNSLNYFCLNPYQPNMVISLLESLSLIEMYEE